MTEEITKMVAALKQKLYEDVCKKHLNCKGCPIRDTFEIDICDFVNLYDTVAKKATKK